MVEARPLRHEHPWRFRDEATRSSSRYRWRPALLAQSFHRRRAGCRVRSVRTPSLAAAPAPAAPRSRLISGPSSYAPPRSSRAPPNLRPPPRRHALGAIDVATDGKYRLLPLVLPAVPIEATSNANLAAGMPFARSLQLDPSAAQFAVPRLDP